MTKYPMTNSVIPSFVILFFAMGGAGFEPAKAEPSDLQSDPFDRFGNPPGPAVSLVRPMPTTFC